MATTQLDAFSQRCAEFLRSEIFPVIVEYSPRRPNPHVPLSVDELVSLLGLPARQLPPPAVVGMMQTPGGPTPPMTQSVPTSRKAGGGALDNIIPGQQCAYKYSRGDNKHKFCGKATVAGAKFCPTCIRTRAAVKAEVDGNGGVAPAAGSIPGMTGAPPAVPPQGNSLNVIEYDQARGLYREPNNNFIIYLAGPEETVTMVGKLVPETNEIVQLNAQERAIAQSLQIALNDTPAAAPVTQRAPAVPQVPAPVPVPQAPVPVAVPQVAVPVPVPQAPVPVAVPQVAVPVAVPQAPVPVAVPQAPVPVAVPQAPVPVAVPQVAVPVPVPQVAVPVAVPQVPAPVPVSQVAVPVAVPQVPIAVPEVPQAIPAIPAVQFAVPVSVPQAIGGIPDIPTLV